MRPMPDEIATVKAVLGIAAETIRIRDEKWREWLAKVLDPVELDAAESMYAPPDRKE